MTSRVQTTAVQQDTSAAPHLAKVVQRSCACGESAGMTDSCESCNANNLAGTRVQAKLVVGPVDDPYEQEADRVADHVMRMPDTDIATTSEDDPGPVIQRACTDCDDEEKLQRQPEEDDEEESIQAKRESGPTGGEVSAQQTTEIESIKAGGEPLRPASRNFFEQRFGHSFSNVRVHSDERAAQSARGINAQAYTTGQHIIFGAGHYSPDTQAGQKLLAHELTHVIQQGGGASRGIQRKATWVPPATPKEAINPAEQLADKKIKTPDLHLGQTNFLLNGQPFTGATPENMLKALKTPGIAYGETTIPVGGPPDAGTGSGSGSGSGSGAKQKTVPGFECWIDSVPDNVGTNEVKVLTQGTWKKTTDKTNVGARFPSLKACVNGFGDVNFVVRGDPDDDTVRDRVKEHEKQHSKDNEKVFSDLVVAWDKELTKAQQDKTKPKAPQKPICEHLLYTHRTTSGSPKNLVANIVGQINKKGSDFHDTAAGKKPEAKPEKPDSDCNFPKARVFY